METTSFLNLIANTLEKYIDYTKLKPNDGGRSNMRLIMTAVNVLTAEPLTLIVINNR